ncbi:OLC1v1023189C1 [Oldenlandia corymbosa var. corymbosa]|uniref:OLC1v1023189C1 n=1 Tax=Oldenlandia corymbosa var. corymbosa TaxID=529605 RepID=A0AAV1BZE5_OLDCO|nr:OLC1v1023189C1 [Oldenlandia corymbosa var. corymbosa]
MPAAATLAHSWLCFSSAQRPSSSSAAAAASLPTSISTSNSEDNNQCNLLPATKPKSLLDKHPLWQPTHTNISLQFKEKILCLEVMGVDSGKALSLNPSLHTASLESIHSIITFLESKGIQQKDMGRIFGMCPQILTSDIKSELNPVFKFLSYDLAVPDQDFRRVINKCPRLLISSVQDQLKPALFYLQRLGFKDVQQLIYQDPVLLVSNVEKTLIPKLDFLVSLGFTRTEAIGMVLRCPGLFTFSIENNFKPKFEYFVKEMEGSLEELKGFPQYFAFSLEKRIKPRHLEALSKGVKVPLPLLLKSTDDEFQELLIRRPGLCG